MFRMTEGDYSSSFSLAGVTFTAWTPSDSLTLDATAGGYVLTSGGFVVGDEFALSYGFNLHIDAPAPTTFRFVYFRDDASDGMTLTTGGVSSALSLPTFAERAEGSFTVQVGRSDVAAVGGAWAIVVTPEPSIGLLALVAWTLFRRAR